MTNIDPRQSEKQSLYNVRMRDAQRHIDRMSKIGKAALWQEIKRFSGFWGEMNTKELIEDIKTILNKGQ